MAQNRTVLALIAAVFAVGALAISFLVAEPFAQLAALVSGFLLFLFVRVMEPAEVKPEPLPVPEPAPPGPQLSDALDAFDDPLLLVEGRRVSLANRTAKRLLGAHIEGVDVRLAIRHPAAAERLIDRAADPIDDTDRIELVGLGEAGRRWEMAIANLPGGGRLVRLADRSQAHAAEQMRVDFVANASHELRTPLATLLGFLETLQDEDAAGDPKTRARFLKVMFDEASRMRSLVDDLMSLSRIEAERYTLPRDPIDLLPLIEEVRPALQQQLEQRESTIRVENAATSTVVAGDRTQLAQLLTNLLTNALRYGQPGAPVTIRIDDSGGGELIRLSVIDKGDGIAPEHLPRLTERFYRVDAGRSRQLGGTGLGLAIVKHIVSRHRGRLDIRSKVGEGTSVRVYLPRAKPVRTAAAHG